MKLVGVSLSFAYLNGQTDNVFHREFGPVSDGLTKIKEAGAQSIELRVASPQTNPTTAVEAARKIWDHGLTFSIHGALPAAPIHDDVASMYPVLHALTPLLDARDEQVMVPLHAYQRAQGSKSDVADESVKSLSRLMKVCDQQHLPFTFAVELNRRKQAIDPADSYEGVEAIHQRVGHPRLGICWDFGHGYTNFMNKFDPANPPESFLKRVTHTHIHDIGPTNKTHWPLTEKRLPLETYVKLLQSVGYQGLWNLEFDPPRYKQEPAIASRILQSIKILSDA